MYGQIHRSVTSTNSRLCKTSLAALCAACANMTIFRPFVKSSIASRYAVVNQLYYLSTTMAFKCMTGHTPEYLSSKFLKRAELNGHSTRNSHLLNIPLFKTASGQRTFYYRIVSLWNSSDYSLCKSVSVFKNRLKTKLLKEL